tara:strand:- start:7 stop:384 length:378 start_codon:yes stop_codon:yes gene_type:complete
MNDKINGEEVISGITAMIDTRVAQSVGDTERVARWVGRIEKRLNIVLREDMDELTKVVQENAEAVERLENLDDAVTKRVVEAITAIENTPDTDKKIVDLELKVSTLEDKVQQMIEALSSVAYLSD